MKTGYDQFFKKVKQTSTVQQRASTSDLRKSAQLAQGKKNKKSSFPIKPLFMFGCVALGGLFALDNLDKIESLFKKVEIGFIGTALAEEKVTHPETEKVAVSADKKSLAVEPKPDEADYMFKLAERKKQLDQREEELNKVSAEILKQKEEIELKLKNLEETRKKISSALEERIKVDDNKVETLVQMYSNMKPQQAAKVFETLDEDLVIEILGRMKKKSAADILNLIKPEKAQIFAERYAGYRVPASK